MRINGQFSLQVIGGDGSLKDSINQDNLVLDGIWNSINAYEFPTKFDIQLGTGNSEPAVTDVTLNEFLYASTDRPHEKISDVDNGNTVCLRCSTEIPAGRISNDTVVLREIGLYDSRGKALITRSLINPEDGGQLITPSDMIKITYDLRFTAPGGLMPQTSSLVINDIEHQISYSVAKLGEISIEPIYLLGSHTTSTSGYASSFYRASGWLPDLVKEVNVDREAREIQVIWEKVFDEFSDATVEQLTLKKASPYYVSGGNYNPRPRDYVTITFDPPIEKREGERLTLNGVFKTTLNY